MLSINASRARLVLNRAYQSNTLIRNPLVQLGAAAILSFLVYWLLFVKPVFLFDFYKIKHLDGDYPVWGDPVFKRRVIAGFALLGALYWMSWRAVRKIQGKSAWAVVIGGWAAFSILLTLFMPIDAADIFDNIVHGRILGIHGENPFILLGRNFPSDPFVPYMAWPRSPSAYGPLWELLAALGARLAGNGIPANIILFKWLPGIFYAASIWVVARLLLKKAPERALTGVLLLAWNPVVLYETFGNGHNDIAMVFWMLAAAWALAERRYSLSILALVAGMLVKFIPVLLVPAAGLIALRELKDWRSRFRFLVVTGLLALALVVIFYLPFWEGPKTLSVARRAQMFSASIPATVYQAIKAKIQPEKAASLVTMVSAVLTLIFSFWQGWRAYLDKSWLGFTKAGYNILMFYLLFTCLWFQQWYTLWPLGMAALIPIGPSLHLAVVFGFAALSKQLIIGPALYSMKPAIPQPWFELQFILGVLLVPWLFVVYLLWRKANPVNRRLLATNKDRRS